MFLVQDVKPLPERSVCSQNSSRLTVAKTRVAGATPARPESVIMLAPKYAPKILNAQTAAGGDQHGDTPNATSPVLSSDRTPGGASKAAASDRRTDGKQIRGRSCPPETRRARSRLCLAPLLAVWHSPSAISMESTGQSSLSLSVVGRPLPDLRFFRRVRCNNYPADGRSSDGQTFCPTGADQAPKAALCGAISPRRFLYCEVFSWQAPPRS